MKNYKNLIWIGLPVLIFCKIIYWLFAEPNADESYYWLWSKYLQLSYHEHPGLQAWVQYVFYSFFGNNVFSLRLPTVLSLIISAYVLSLIMKKLKFKNITLTILIFFSLPLFFIFTSFAWSDYLLITTLLTSSYFWLNYLDDKWNNKKGTWNDVILSFFFLGLAALSKFNSVFLALALISLILFNKRLHSIFKDLKVYFGLIVCLIVISPVFIWNYSNDNGAFQFSLIDRVITPLISLRFRGNIAGFIIGSAALIPFTLWWYIFKKGIKKNKNIIEASYNLIYFRLAKHLFLWSSITFLIMSLSSIVLYYWNIPALILIIPLAINHLTNNSYKWTKITLIYSMVINILVVIHLTIIPLDSFISGTKDVEMSHNYGWNEISSKTVDLISERGGVDSVQILTSSYRTASQLSFKLDRDDIYSYSPSYSQINYWTKGIKYKNRNALVIIDDWKPLGYELNIIIEDMRIIDTISVSKWGYHIKDYYIYDAYIIDQYLEEVPN